MTDSPVSIFNADNSLPTPEKLVYHYTDGAGVLGIASTGFLWATHARFLSDSSEVHASFTYAASLLQANYREAHPDLVEGIDRFVKYVREAGRITPNIFIACFSEAPDLLSQWRGYGGGGGQTALGFNVDELRRRAQDEGWRLERCIYDRTETYARMTSRLDHVVEYFYENLHDTHDHSREQTLSNMLYSEILQISPTMKNAAFAEEKEWRLISPVTSVGREGNVKFRLGKSSLIPYREFGLPRQDDRLRIPHYYVGPGREKALASEALWMMFREKKVATDGMTVSQIPFLP